MDASHVTGPSYTLAKDRAQRIRQVNDVQKAEDKKAALRVEKIRDWEEREIHENVERSFQQKGGFGRDIFAGFGDGQTGSKGTYVFRDGQLVPKNQGCMA